MLRFHSCILASAEGPPIDQAALAIFDDALDALARHPRLFIELDGSFVWRGTDDEGTTWQVDGSLVDRGDRLDYVEIKGSCPEERLDDILRAIGWPAAALSFQLPRVGVFLTEEEFRRQAASPSGAG